MPNVIVKMSVSEYKNNQNVLSYHGSKVNDIMHLIDTTSLFNYYFL